MYGNAVVYKVAARAVGSCAFCCIQDKGHYIKTSPLLWGLKFYTGYAAVDCIF